MIVGFSGLVIQNVELIESNKQFNSNLTNLQNQFYIVVKLELINKGRDTLEAKKAVRRNRKILQMVNSDSGTF